MAMTDSMIGRLEDEWDGEMRRVYHDARELLGYNAMYFIQMVSEHGGVSAAHMLLQKTGFSDGLTELWKRRRLDLTMEARMFQRDQSGGYKWRTLFTPEEFEIARQRLKDLTYLPAVSGSL
jgi:hypothetical protein